MTKNEAIKEAMEFIFSGKYALEQREIARREALERLREKVDGLPTANAAGVLRYAYDLQSDVIELIDAEQKGSV